MPGPAHTYRREDIQELDALVHHFGEHVAFDKEKWRAGEYEACGLYP